MFTMQNKDLKRLERFLVATRSRAFPFAVQSTLNTAAFDTRKQTVKNISDDLVERNKFTRNSIRVEKTKTLQIEQMESRAGSVAPFFPALESGGIKRPTSGGALPIPTSEASGEGRNAIPRRRLPMRANQMRNIKLKHRSIRLRASVPRKNRRKIRNIVAVKMAQAAGGRNKFAYIDTGRRKAIVKVMGGRKNPKVKTVVDLTHRSVTIPPNPVLQPAFKRTEKRLPIIYTRAVRFQLRRAGLVT